MKMRKTERGGAAGGGPPKKVRTLWGSALAYRLVIFVLSAGFAAGIGIMLYPYAQRLLFAYRSARSADDYLRRVSAEDAALAEEEYQRALAWNAEHRVNLIAESALGLAGGAAAGEEYESLLNLTGSGMMGVLDIPKIGARLCVYPGVDEMTLLRGVGHIEGSGLPVGGESTHCVLSGHRGLAAAALLTDLDQLQKGDEFYMHVLGHDLAYEVDQILTVLPSETDALQITEGEDLLTLVTCTPYAVNSHRLLVRGHRVPYENEVISMPAADLMQWLTPVKIAVIGLLLLALIIAAVILIRRRNRRKRTESKHKKVSYE